MRLFWPIAAGLGLCLFFAAALYLVVLGEEARAAHRADIRATCDLIEVREGHTEQGSGWGLMHNGKFGFMSTSRRVPTEECYRCPGDVRRCVSTH